MNTGVSYSMFYEVLLNLREYFHSYGRIDDSNAKLDEITKLIALNFSLAKKGEKFSLKYIRENMNNESSIAQTLIYVFENEVKNEIFFNSDGTNIFGMNPSLNLQLTEDELAEKLISEIEKIDFLHLVETKQYSDFDLINECFGHFVRENFRNNKEDAQYMTPYEISQPMLDIIFNDMENDGYFEQTNLGKIKIMDPTCGVGTLLIESSNHYTRYIESKLSNSKQCQETISEFRNNGIIGQDKVDRMVRLSKINALLLGSNILNINSGNSIIGTSSISSYFNSIDLIFTNPPFGAEYNTSELNLNEYPVLNSFNSKPSNIASELLMLDKCIALLKENGYLAIVLPDSVFASKGIYSEYRSRILDNYSLRGVIGLPSVTFAQAGTRTNTCILYLQKKNSSNPKFFMADCKDLGFNVKERIGVPVKIQTGINQMPIIASSLKKIVQSETVLCTNPSITYLQKEDLIDNILKPNFYAASRYAIVDSLASDIKTGYTIKKLSDVADFVTKNRKGYMVSDIIKHVSVLHVNQDCTINFKEVVNFVPVSKGRRCKENDIIFSKLNPRIPRIAVIPETEYSLVCSNEFEILRAKDGINPYILCYLLKTDKVRGQIESMTSGTSSSHSRIKREQLEGILLPFPIEEKELTQFEELGNKIEKATKTIYNAEDTINFLFDSLNTL